VIALRDMIKLICRRTNLSREQAYTLCSLAADLRVTQVVNGNKGIHVMLEKKLLSSAGRVRRGPPVAAGRQGASRHATRKPVRCNEIWVTAWSVIPRSPPDPFHCNLTGLRVACRLAPLPAGRNGRAPSHAPGEDRSLFSSMNVDAFVCVDHLGDAQVGGEAAQRVGLLARQIGCGGRSA